MLYYKQVFAMYSKSFSQCFAQFSLFIRSKMLMLLAFVLP